MINKFSPFALGLAGAFAMISAVCAQPAAQQNLDREPTGSIAAPSPEKDGVRVYCFNGAARDGTKTQRGWVCQQDTGAASDAR
ncbi:hypothetical protein Msil_1339 [Methylocella silvestris BL2]|uniref:Hemolysin n=1 Tax=Methylocella silvestris (strain DSM 15510 / CIP 108128 / LMG 27833 / NCIMB 13906 / BL2) TaxID=395965 RepID=B8ERC0_METSB|nr:hypothetical protein [Methylocella silvestris]ACK50304.1 hypothetical protein Msil_1339 [Methylocella silvestris BL2]